MMHGFKLQSATAIAAAVLRYGRSSTPHGVHNCCRICPQFSTNSIKPTQIQPRSEFEFKTKLYDVFVSFRGKDIRQGFLSHLVEAFPRKQLHAFVDDKLERGDEISSSLLGAIERSSISLIIFSEDYASSRWCLEELEKIVECKEKYGQAMIPVFYHVDPTHVRYQTGSYEKALFEHEKIYDSTRVQIWRHALNKSANLSGIKSSDFQNDAKLIEEIVKIIDLQLIRMGKHPVDSKGLIGIEKTIGDLKLLLHQESKDVRVIGIWGMGGIGKTTIAEELFNRISFEYEGCCFLANVREESERQGITSLKQKLHATLFADDVKIDTTNGLPNYIDRRISRKKVLIVLDDLNDSDQREKIIGNLERLGSGSRIIITTRDKQVLISNNVDDIYEVRVLSSNEALDLFRLKAFNQNDLGVDSVEYDELSRSVVNYAKGIPLVLKVLGHLLHGKDKEVWESQLNKLKRSPSKKVHDVMRLSYDDLDREEQKIFLDLACFFSRVSLKVDYVKSLLKDHPSDNSVIVGLERLKDKALITISEDNVISMHDLIKEMAWEIVRNESKDDIGSRSQLWDPNDIYDVLKNDKGTKAIRSITTHPSTLKNLDLRPDIFAKMSKLQFLDFHEEGIWLYPREDDGSFSVLLPQGLQSLPNELRYLCWMFYPLKMLPKQFSLEKLVILNLSNSQVEKLWDGVKNLANLKEVDLTGCEFLQELPDLSKATNLESLDINYCYQLTSVHPSILSLEKLTSLQAEGCISLTRLSSDTPLSSLSCLNLNGCKSLQEFSVTSENMTTLILSATGIKAMPSSFGRQSKLQNLELEQCKIESLPSCIKNFTRLRNLIIDGCSELQILPELPPSLEILYASYCRSLMTVLFPSTAAEQFKENRKSVMFINCLKLDQQSLMAIGLNAQINLTKFAYQHLPTPEFENHYYQDQINLHLALYAYYFDHALYAYPGSSVPDWLTYKTLEGDYITIDLSSTPPSPPLGFIFCFILEKDAEFHHRRTQITISISDAENEGNEGHITIGTLAPYRKLMSDHVYVMYDQPCSSYLNSRAKSMSKFKIEATIWAKWTDEIILEVTEGTQGRINRKEALSKLPVALKGFGVSIINASAYHNLIQKLELHD